MHEHEAPWQRRSVLDLADDRLCDENGEQRPPQRQELRVAVAQPPQEPADEEDAEPERGGDADVDVDGVGDLEAEALHVLVRARMRPGRRRDRPGHDERRAGGDSGPGDELPEPARPGRRCAADDEPPRLDRDDDREREHDHREQEVRHHRERVEVDRDRDRAHRDLGDGDEERAERGEPSTARQPRHARGAEPGEEREREPDERDDPVAELDERVEALLRVGLVAAARPVLAPEPGSGQPHERARGDDEEERHARRERELEERGGRERPNACERRFH